MNKKIDTMWTYLVQRIDKKSIGLCLVVIGVYLGNYIRILFGINLVNVLMLFAIFLLTDFKNIVRLKFPSLNPRLSYLLLSQIIIVVYNFFSDYQMEYVMLFYSIAIIISFSSNNRDEETNSFVFYLFLLSSICVFLAFYSFTGGSGYVDVNQASSAIVKETEVDDKSMAFIYPNTALINAFSCLCMLKEKILYRKILLVIILFDLFFILACGKRTPLIALVLCLFYYFWETDSLKLSSKSFRKIPWLILLLFFGYYFCNKIDLIHSFIDSSIDNIEAGISIILNLNTSSFDESAYTRVLIRQQMLSIYDNFSWYNYLFGYGIFGYGDQPLLQSLLDMGLVGFFVYIYFILLYPLKLIFKKQKRKGVLFFTFMSMANILTCMTAGMPYGYLLYYPIAGLIFFSTRVRPISIEKIYEER